MSDDLCKHHLIAPRSLVSQEMREARQQHTGMVFWLTGFSGSGKSTLAHLVEAALFAEGYNIVVFDGDVVRSGLCRDLGFSPQDRTENNRRIAEAAKLFVRNGSICLCAFISPSAEMRNMAREIIGPAYFREVYVCCSLEECERRDVKGLYHKARLGLISNYTGIGSVYETPVNPDFTLYTDTKSEQESAGIFLQFIKGEAEG